VNIQFALPWGSRKAGWSKAFKHQPIADMVEVYRERISHYIECDVALFTDLSASLGKVDKRSDAVHWICDLPRNRRAKVLSSEELAKVLQEVMNRGTSKLRIFVGGPDGWSAEDLEKIQPQLVWSFGPMTLTHEMSVLIATEQIYRAISIIKGLPYHSDHL